MVRSMFIKFHVKFHKFKLGLATFFDIGRVRIDLDPKLPSFPFMVLVSCQRFKGRDLS